MTPEPILAYSAYWHAPSNSGRVVLKLDNDQIVQVPVDSAAELHAMTALLREHRQCYWDPSEQLLSTRWATPGHG